MQWVVLLIEEDKQMVLDRLIEQLQKEQAKGHGDKEVVILDPVNSSEYYSRKTNIKPYTTVEDVKHIQDFTTSYGKEQVEAIYLIP